MFISRLLKSGKNAFYDEKDKYHLSMTAKYYIAGILAHAPEITAICNQWIDRPRGLSQAMKHLFMFHGRASTAQRW